MLHIINHSLHSILIHDGIMNEVTVLFWNVFLIQIFKGRLSNAKHATSNTCALSMIENKGKV
jgi:hypothetical protein